MLLAAGCALALLTSPVLPAWNARRTGLALPIGAAVALGSLIAIHPWDFPVFATLIGIVLFARSVDAGKIDWRSFGYRAALVVGGAVVLYVPFFFSGRGSVDGIQPTEVFFRNAATVNSEGMYLPFQHFLIFWTPLMLPAVLYVLWCLSRRGWHGLRAYGVAAAAAVCALPLAWGIAVAGGHHLSGLHSELTIRGWGWLTVACLGTVLVLASAALWDEITSRTAGSEKRATIFLLAAILVGVLLVYGPELFIVRDSSGTRANTTFKLWYASWALLAFTGAAGSLHVFREWRAARAPFRVLRPIALGLSAAVLAGALVYPAYAIFVRTNGFTGPRTLDGEAFLRSQNPDELGAADWLNANVPGVQTVLEASGQSYGEPGRIASRTGLPTVLDWTFHEQQQRGPLLMFATREEDVRTIYTTTNLREAFDLLAKYGVKYIVVGEPERSAYGSDGLAKFATIGTPVYQSNSVNVYRIGSAPLYATVP
jgi:uncharacterized membrane protein